MNKPPRTRREMGRAAREADQRRRAAVRKGLLPPPKRVVVPPVMAFALVMLGMCALGGVGVGGILMLDGVWLGVAFFATGLLAAAIGWALATGRSRGYWGAIGYLGLVGLVPGGFAFAYGDVVTGVVLLAPLAVALIMLRPTIRAELAGEPAGSFGDRDRPRRPRH